MFHQHLEEQQITRIYETMTNEQSYLMEQVKAKTSEEEQSDLMKELSIVNSLTMGLLRLRNMKRKHALKRNL